MNSLKIGGLITSIILGAGFLSGKELLKFFGQFKAFGYLGIFLSSLIIYIISTSIMKITYTYNIKTVDEFILKVFNNNKKIHTLVQSISILFMFVIFSAMTSAFSEIVMEHFNISKINSILIFGMLTIIFIVFGIRLLVSFSAFVTPVLFLGTTVILVFYLSSTENVFSLGSRSIYSGLYSKSIIYASYNILTTIALLVTSTSLIKEKKEIYISGIIGALGIFVIGSMLFIPIELNYESIYAEPLPIFQILSSLKNSYLYTNLYVTLFLLAIITTGITSCFGAITSITPKNNLFISTIVISLGLYLSTLGFETFISTIYPFFSIFGIIEVYFILRLAIRTK